jgi:phage-related protein
MKSIFTGALIGDEHTLHDWGAVITNSDVIGMPEPSTVLLEVPGRSGRLDLSEVLTGDVTYSNREIKLELAAQTNRDRWVETCFHIFNKYHGRVVHVIFDEDPGHFYVGRCSITSPKRVATAGTMVITIDAEPYRYESEVYEVTLTGATNTLSGTVENLRMPAVPKVTVPGACQLFVGGKVYELAAGEDLDVPGLVFGPYGNPVSVTGASSITFRFRRGCL